MSWAPADLVTDLDLQSYERTILSQFGVTDWQHRRAKALEDWLFPLLETRGFQPHRLRTRHTPVKAFSTTSAVTTDRTTAIATENGLNLATILAASSDYLYVGFYDPFRGLSVRVLDNVNTVDGTLSVALWADGWTTPNDIADGTRINAKSFAKGGAMTWSLPEGVVTRSISSSDPAYWVRLSLSASPTGCLIGPVSVIRRSRLCAAVTMRTLALIFREAPIGQDGPWREKAEWYEQEAERAFLRVADQLGPEFDTDGDDTIGASDRNQTAAEVNGGGWTLERA